MIDPDPCTAIRIAEELAAERKAKRNRKREIAAAVSTANKTRAKGKKRFARGKARRSRCLSADPTSRALPRILERKDQLDLIRMAHNKTGAHVMRPQKKGQRPPGRPTGG